MGPPHSSRSPDSSWSSATKSIKKNARKSSKVVMRSYHFRIPKYDVPVRLRPWFILFTILIMSLLAFLGFTNFSHSLPFNDKFLHFFCMMSATGVFYFIFDVEEEARRVWVWRVSPLLFTGFVCFVVGGIVSEIVQSLLPYKKFEIGDIAANLLGSSFGLAVAYYLEKYYRHRREIHRLYRPLNTSVESLSDTEEDLEAGTQLLPMEHSSTGAIMKATRLEDVWDEREELFDIGGDSDDEGGPPPAAHTRANGLEPLAAAKGS